MTLQRRRLLRGGALLAGAAAGAAAITAAGTTKAEAANGDPVLVGEENTGTNPTSLANSNGPSLRLAPLANDWEGPLAPGEIANTYAGPYIGVSDGPSAPSVVSYLATGIDLAALPVPFPYDKPDRALDTRTPTGRARVLRTSPSPYASGRLKKDAWLDVAISPADDEFTVEGAFLNVTAIDALGNGFLAVYKPGDRPQVATTRFAKGVTATSSAFMALGVLNDAFVIRVYTSYATNVIIDVTGVSLNGLAGPAAPAAVKRQPVRRGSAAVKPQRLVGRRAAR